MVSGLHLIEALDDFRRQPGTAGVAELPRNTPMLVARSTLNVGFLTFQIPFVLHASSQHSECRGGSLVARVRNPSLTSFSSRRRWLSKPLLGRNSRTADVLHRSGLGRGRGSLRIAAHATDNSPIARHRLSPTSRPLGVSRRSALSTRNSSRYSARDVNIR